jgi:peptide/nickel transport system permease protein
MSTDPVVSAPHHPDSSEDPGAREDLLRVRDLSVYIGRGGDNAVMPLQGVDLDVHRGSRVGLVGESGSGKSLTAAAILGMLPPRAETVAGSIRLLGEEIVGARERRLQRLRGSHVAIMFQNPKASLNPVLTVGGQIAEVIRVHEDVSRRESHQRAIDLLDQMGIPDAKRRAGDYVHQYSGGMAQRAALAMALSCQPDLLIADEPTSGLDATLQQQVLELVVEQVERRSASLLLITHDIGIVEQTCDQVAVLYAGRVMESGFAAAVLSSPANPYTRELLRAYRSVEPRRMNTIPGTVPALHSVLDACPFVERCPDAVPECSDRLPLLREHEDRRVACIRV